MNIGELYKIGTSQLEKAGIKTSAVDARILLKQECRITEAFLLSHPEYEPSESQILKFQKSLNKRKKYIPIAYITGTKEFYGHDFDVNKFVLIPRPESEFLVAKALEAFKNVFLARNESKQLSVLDMGTGSGCIITSLAIELIKEYSSDDFRLYAVDNSEKALSVAKKNAKKHGVSNQIKFFKSDLFSNDKLPEKFDLILANLPYVSLGQKNLQKDIAFEPKEAIFGGEIGSEISSLFLKEAKNRTTKIIMEIDENSIPLADEHNLKITKDLSGKIRYLSLNI